MSIAQQDIPVTRRHTQHIVYDLACIIRERDIITYEHCRRVALYVNRLARSMGWSRRAARDLALAGLVHDLGKIWMHNTVLHKKTALSNGERAEMERHPQIAASILAAYGAPVQLVDIVKHHHESFDGTGYPDHLAGSAIPLGARLLTVADVFDVLTSDRPYKLAFDLDTARERIVASSGTHFDPCVIDALLTLLDATSDFILPARVSPLPVRMAANPSWSRHDAFDE